MLRELLLLQIIRFGGGVVPDPGVKDVSLAAFPVFSFFHVKMSVSTLIFFFVPGVVHISRKNEVFSHLVFFFCIFHVKMNVFALSGRLGLRYPAYRKCFFKSENGIRHMENAYFKAGLPIQVSKMLILKQVSQYRSRKCLF